MTWLVLTCREKNQKFYQIDLYGANATHQPLRASILFKLNWTARILRISDSAKNKCLYIQTTHTHSYTLAWLAVSVLDCLWAVCMRRANNVNEWQSAGKRQTETRNAFLSSLADMCGCLLFSLLLLLFWCFFHLLYFNALFCSYMIHCACVFFLVEHLSVCTH